MNESTKNFTLHAIHNLVSIKRTEHGVPLITANNREDLCFAIGYAQAWDRMVQLMLVRSIGHGRASEDFAGTDDLIAVDRYMRWLFLRKDTDAEIEKLTPDTKRAMDAYCAGINRAIATKKRPLEFRMVGYTPAPWTIQDSILTAKLMGYIGLAQAQGDMEKFLVQMIQREIPEKKLRALFPYLTEEIDYALIKQIQLQQEPVPGHLWKGVLPDLRASNSWAISGTRTKSGKAMLATDPHMDVNRLPALWYEMIWQMNDTVTMGITMPGLPVMVMGRTRHLAWGGTYAFMDMIDYFIEDCRDEKFCYDGQWLPFEKRTEIIRPRKKQPIELTFFENQHGVLEGDPGKPGKYLSMAFTGRSGVGADILNNILAIDTIKTVAEARQRFREVSVPTMNWVFADDAGNIGYQMSGRMPQRKKGLSGLLPIPGWMPENDWQGFVDPALFPQSENPEAGYLATANNDLNALGKAHPINLPMAAYRFQRIMDRLQHSDSVDRQYIQRMQYDVYSKQAERLIMLFIPLLPDHLNADILQNWNMSYVTDSKSATIFESLYLNCLKIVFGAHGIGADAMEHLLTRTSLFTDFYGNFDDVLMDEQSAWFEGLNRDAVIQEAIAAGLDIKPLPYGKTHSFDMMNIFLGGKLPGFLGFDIKNKPMIGCRATISQGQIWNNAGRINTFAPSFRMIVDFAEDGLWTNLPGGPSGSRISRWYTSDLDNWEKGIYKYLAGATAQRHDKK
ncbi:MAG: penicillin acylase family protein [Candidatus Zhuqueibacterota bacterium]